MKKNNNIRKSDYIRQFKVDASFLSKEELLILEKLVEAAQLVAKVYRVQLADGFYPTDVTRQEIEKAAQANPLILSPYSVVERDESGKLIAIPYHKKYKNLLLPVAQRLIEAAEVPLHRRDFRQALLMQAKALLNGDYDKAQINWIKNKPYLIDIVIGPIERNEDNLFFVKRAYQAWVGIMNQNVTDRVNVLKEVVFSARRRQILPSESVDFIKKAQFRIDNTVIFAGLIANYCYTGTTLPNDISLLEKYGSESWVFLPSVWENFEKRHYPLFNLIFAPDFKTSFNKDLLHRGYLLMVTMHEITRTLIRYRFAVDRLKELFPVFNEATIESLAVKLTGSLLLKDVISQKEMEAVLVMFLTRMFDGYVDPDQDKNGSGSLVLGNAILLNSLIQSEALRVTKQGISWPNFTKMFISVCDLAFEMEQVLASGNYSDAKHYIDEHSSPNVFKKFSAALKTLHNA